MTTNQTIDGVPREAVAALEKSRDVLRAIILDKSAGVHYASAQAACHQINNALDELRALLDAPTENAIDVSATDWAAIQEAASESTWMPPEYMRNDWVADVCRFLREGAAAQLGAEGFYQQVTDADIKKISDYMGNPDMPTGAFLRQDAYDLANMTTHMCREVQALRNKLAAQPQGEPVAMSREQFEAWVLGREHPIYGWLDKHWLALGDNPETYADPYVQGLWVASQSIYAEQPAPVAVVLPERIQEAEVETLFQEGKRVGWNGYDDEMRKRMNNG